MHVDFLHEWKLPSEHPDPPVSCMYIYKEIYMIKYVPICICLQVGHFLYIFGETVSYAKRNVGTCIRLWWGTMLRIYRGKGRCLGILPSLEEERKVSK